MPSRRQVELEMRIAELQRYLLPDRFQPPGTYDDEECVVLGALAFRVLAHAELEAYFEDRVVEIATTAWLSFKNSGFVSGVILALVGFCGRELHGPPKSLAAPDANKAKHWNSRVDISERIQDIVQTFVKEIKSDNHGIREWNIIRMLLPIGLHFSKIDSVFLTELDEFGRRRGEAAHSSRSAPQVRQGVDPEEELRYVQRLLEGLSGKGGLLGVDGLLDERLAASRPTLDQ